MCTWVFSEHPGSCENGFDKNIGRPCVPEGWPGYGATKEPREPRGMREEGGVDGDEDMCS